MTTLTTQHDAQAERTPSRMAAVAAASGFLGIAAFQVALALGAPLGHAAFGGNYERLPVSLRMASASAVGFWLLAALIILGRAGFEVPLPRAMFRRGTWILVGVSGFGALLNFASRSDWERFLWGPVALILAGLCLKVARGDLATGGSSVITQGSTDDRGR